NGNQRLNCAPQGGEMADLRKQWLKVVNKHKLHPEGPANDRYWAPELETCPRDKIREIQEEKLLVSVKYLYEYSPFYREKFEKAKLHPTDIKSLDDLLKIPITTKTEMVEDVKANPPWGTYTAIDEHIWTHRGWMMFATSGTTAAPRAFRHTLHDRDIWAWNDARAMWAMGLRPGDSALIAFGYAPHVFFWGVHYALDLMGIPVISRGSLDTRRTAYFIDTFKPTILGATPSYALYLGDVMKEMGYDPAKSSIRLIVTGGEPGATIASTKRRIETLWNAELHEFYGCTEASPTAGGYTCHYQASRKDGPVSDHLMEDIQIWETVDPQTLEPVPPGQRGLSVVTNLFSEAAPLVRFLVGDYTVLNYDPCPCGRTHALAVGGFYGRDDDMLNIRGVTVFPSAIEEVVRGFAEVGDEFQIVVAQEKMLDVLTIVAEPRPEVPEKDYPALARRIQNEVRAKVEVRPEVDLKPYGTLPKTEFKAKRVMDRRNVG
ncbi:MAG: AMP-binding protein, partial [Dehalococcoidia bacterium]|nr:AMP-binding protein [Dehalococcoidia bacterium]